MSLNSPKVEAVALTIRVTEAESVSGLLQAPADAWAGCVMAHGAGAGMRHPFLAAMADGLAERGIATLRYQFLYMERGSKRPDAPPLAHAAVRAAVDEAARRWPNLPLLAGGKSFGARMTSQAQAQTQATATAAAAASLPGVRGLVFLGFPLHPPGRPSTDRAPHLFDVKIPMLFLQGSRDEFAELALLEPLGVELGARATLRIIRDADHSFHVPARSGRKDADVREELCAAIAEWAKQVIGQGARSE